MNSYKPTVFIVGPTCSGKTDLAFYLSLKLNGVIINADSLQFYKGFDIGSAKPDFKKFPSIPCHLFDCITPPEIFTAGQFEKESLSILHQNLKTSLCFVVGGSGFYIRALEKGCYPIQKFLPKIKEQLLKEEKSKGLSFLYEELKLKDPDYKIHSHDRYRILRALGLIRSQGVKMSQAHFHFKSRPFPYPLIKIGLTGSKDALKKRVKLRTKNMIYRGLLKEVENLLIQGLRNFQPLKSVGYKEALLCLDGKLSKDQLEEAIIQRTLKLIKKQKTWFKKDPSIRWYDCESHFEDIFDDLKTKI